MFKKYPSIENSYQQKSLIWWTEHFPELENETYIIQEKIDGSNMQWVFAPNEPIRLFSRNQEVERSGNTFSWVWGLMNEKYADEFPLLQEHAVVENESFRLYGEAYGHMKRVNYGEKGLCFFDLAYGNPNALEWATPFHLSQFLENVGVYMKVPYLAVRDGLVNALEYPNDKPTTLNKRNGSNIMEGVVIKPYRKVYQSTQGSIFYLKNKNDKFSENKPSNKKPVPLNSRVIELKLAFQDYINENRVASVFSKHGEIQTPKEIGKYIKLLLEDALEDFEREYDLTGLDKKEMGQITNAKPIVELLKTYL